METKLKQRKTMHRSGGGSKKVVLIGTYLTGQFDKWRGYYNYPIMKGESADPAAYEKVSELWLFKGQKNGLYRVAEFIGIKTRSELVKEYKYPAKGKGHGERYALYKTHVLYVPSEESDKVIVRVRDFARRSPSVARQLKEYLESPDRDNPVLAKRLPKILVGIPPERLCVCEGALEYDCLAPAKPVVFEPTIDPDFQRDILESEIPEDVLAELLKDRTTGKNILWMTDSYRKFEDVFDAKMGMMDEITAKVIANKNTKILRPRVDKSKEEQRDRVVGKAEVFTPSWICNAMCNLVDAAWFDLPESPFTKEGQKSWTAKTEKLPFAAQGKSWEEYVRDVRLEMTCGEAPFLASRYDTTTGVMIPIPERIGFFDRKLRVITEQVGTRDPEKWLEWAIIALKATIAFEWQGDNLFIARENILYTLLEYYKYYCKRLVDHDTLLELARIISWNVWQMDGLKMVVPLSCHDEPIVPPKPKEVQLDLFAPAPESVPEKQLPLMKKCEGCAKKTYRGHNGIYCKIMDWTLTPPQPIEFVSLIREKEDKK